MRRSRTAVNDHQRSPMTYDFVVNHLAVSVHEALLDGIDVGRRGCISGVFLPLKRMAVTKAAALKVKKERGA